MPLSRSIEERIEYLEEKILAKGSPLGPYVSVPFAIFPYPPSQEYRIQEAFELLGRRLEEKGKGVISLSLAELMYEAIEEEDGLEYLFQIEKEIGAQVVGDLNYLTKAIQAKIVEYLEPKDPGKNVVILKRAGALYPAIEHLSGILNGLENRVRTPSILLYPGSVRGLSLSFMNMTEPLSYYRATLY